MSEKADYRRGQILLRSLMPWARAEAKKPDHDVKLQTELAWATAAYVTEDNLDALVIYPAPLGGWHADITFKNVPPGLPNSMGSPVGKPYPTRRVAEESAKRMLVGILKIATMEKSSGDPVFLLYDCVFRMAPEIYAITQGYEFQEKEGESDLQATAIARIEELLSQLYPEGFSRAKFEESDIADKATLFAALHIATLRGVYVYPPRLDATPSGHTTTSKAQH